MENEKHNECLDAVIYFMEKDGKITIFNHETGSLLKEAIRKARAWDKLEAQLQGHENNRPSSYAWRPVLLRKMAELLNPQPKDPLEELEKFIKRLQPVELPGVWAVYRDKVLTEIRRLRGKK